MQMDLSNETQQRLIVFTGPESCGKSTMATAVGKRLEMPVVEEFARAYLESSAGKYERGDLEKIARGQLASVEAALSACSGLVITDTFLLNIRIWEQVRFGACSPGLEALFHRYRPAHYVLFRPDIPWVQDLLRDNEGIRQDLFDLFNREIEESEVGCSKVGGDGDARFAAALNAMTGIRK